MSRFIPSKVQESYGVGGLIAAIMMGLAYLNLIYPADFFSGTSSYWLAQNEDITQYIAGFNAYFIEPWQWPLFKVKSFNYPVGTRSTFLDIIPLYSFFLKLLVPKSFFPFNPFGLWIGLCVLLQAVAGWWILRVLKMKSWPSLIVLCGMLILSPPLAHRIGHISLMSHWIILFALGLYLYGSDKKYRVSGWSVLLVAAFFINIYLFTMAFVVYFASFWRWGWTVRKVGLFVVPLLLIGITLCVTILPLPLEDFARDFGFGYYSMNMISPFSGGYYLRFINPEMAGQGEGYNYLGLGILGLAVYGFRLQWRNDQQFFRRHALLFWLMIIMALYSLSNKVYLGQILMVNLHYPSFLDGITAQLRCSGRFFWPVGYSIVVFSVIMVTRHRNAKIGIYILLLALTVQIFDVRLIHKHLEQTAKREAVQFLNYSQWDKLLSSETEMIYFYPKFRCSTSSLHTSLLPVMAYASVRGLKMNTGYIARYQPQCNDIVSEIKHSSSQKSLYVFVRNEFTEEAVHDFFPENMHVDCVQKDFALVCRTVSE